MSNKYFDSTMSATSSVGDMFTSSANYVKNQTSTLSWEKIIIICLSILLFLCIFNNKVKDHIITSQNAEIRRSISASISNRNNSQYDD
jgi:hypothetical protein